MLIFGKYCEEKVQCPIEEGHIDCHDDRFHEEDFERPLGGPFLGTAGYSEGML